VKVFGIVGRKNSGKTHLVTRLVHRPRNAGCACRRSSTRIHSFDIDRPGKDSHLHREAGAREVLVASAERWALMHEHRGAQSRRWRNCCRSSRRATWCWSKDSSVRSNCGSEVYRASCGQAPLAFEDDGIVAVATDDATTFAARRDLRCLPLDDEAAVLDYVLARG
jgi:molybdopterin-guanine dinucleotide biosynthesis protein B